MKRMIWKRLGAMLLSLMGLVWSLPGARAGFMDWEEGLAEWLERESALRFSLSMEVHTLLPFTQEQTDRLNALLKYLSFGAALERDGSAALTAISLSVGGTPAMTLTEREESGAFALETSLLPNRRLESQTRSPLEALALEEDGDDETLVSFRLLEAISQAQESYPALIAACEPFAEKKKANYKIKDIGTAKWSQIARLTTEQSDDMLPLLRAVVQSGMDDQHRAELSEVRFAKGFVVALYKLQENGEDMAVYMKGNLIFPDKTTVPFAYQWAFTEAGNQRKDTYKYELNRKVSAGGPRTVAASLTQKNPESELSLVGTVDLTTKGKGYTRAETEKIQLSGLSGGATRTLAGSYSQQVKLTVDGKTQTTLSTLTPDVALIVSGEEALLSGKVQWEEKNDKTITSDITLAFAPELPEDFALAQAETGLYMVTEDWTTSSSPPQGSLFQNVEEDPALQPPASDDFLVGGPPAGLTAYSAPQSPTTQNVDAATPAQIKALREEMAQNLAGRLLLSLTGLPQEALAIFQDGMTDEDYASFLSLLGNS